MSGNFILYKYGGNTAPGRGASDLRPEGQRAEVQAQLDEIRKDAQDKGLLTEDEE